MSVTNTGEHNASSLRSRPLACVSLQPHFHFLDKADVPEGKKKVYKLV